MIKVNIIDAHNDVYMFTDGEGKIHMAKMWFEKFAVKPEVGDYMFISKSIITDHEERTTPKTYGPFTNLGFARNPENMTEKDFIVIVNDERMLVYQRYYG